MGCICCKWEKEDYETFILRATHDFDSEQITPTEGGELCAAVLKQMKLLGHSDTEDVESESDTGRSDDLMQPGTSSGNKQIDHESDTVTLEGNGYSRLTEEESDNESQEEIIKVEEQETDTEENGLTASGQSLMKQNLVNNRSSVLSVALPFKRGEEMETIDPAYNRNFDGWWFVQHLNSGNTGFVPINLVIIEYERNSSNTTEKATPKDEEKLTLRAIQDFDPVLMDESQEKELETVLQVTAKLNGQTHTNEQRYMQGPDDEIIEMRMRGNRQHYGKINDYEYNGNVTECDLSRRKKNISQGTRTRELETKGYRRLRDEISDNESPKEVNKMLEQPAVIQEGRLTTENKKIKTMSLSETRDFQADNFRRWVIPLKRGEKLRTIRPENIGDTDGWWPAENLSTGRVGFVPRNRVVLDNYRQPSMNTLDKCPLELVDMVLERSILHWILISSSGEKDKDVFNILASVDLCWYGRITKPRFRKRFWERLKDFYGKTRKGFAIVRNNQNYLLEYIQPNDKLLSSLLSLSCITREQSHLIKRRRLNKQKNAEFLHVVRSFSKTQFSNFVECLRQTNQTAVKRVFENGGVVMTVAVKACGTANTMSIDPQLLHQRISGMREKAKPRSYQTDEIISELKANGIEILNSQPQRHNVIVWIWCQSHDALENIQRMYGSNQLTKIFFRLADIPIHPVVPKAINISYSEFKKTVVLCPITVNFNHFTALEADTKFVFGVTKLRNEIYVLFLTRVPYHILVYEDIKPYHLQRKIELDMVECASDIGSSEKENCLYVAGSGFIWKITREADNQIKIMKWPNTARESLSIEVEPKNISINTDGQLLVVNDESPYLVIYGSDAILFRSIPLPKDIENPRHAVETSIGNFIILYRCMVNDDEIRIDSDGRRKQYEWNISEVTRDGHMVIRRFIPSNKQQILTNPQYLALDSDDRVFVADNDGALTYGRVILLDPDLKWNRILCPTGEKEEVVINSPQVMCYDEGKKQLVVGGLMNVIGVYALGRKF